MNNDIMISIPLDDYTSLVEDRKELYLLVDAIFKNSTLHYRGDKLTISDDDLEIILNIFEPMMYAKRVENLKKESEETE